MNCDVEYQRRKEITNWYVSRFYQNFLIFVAATTISPIPKTAPPNKKKDTRKSYIVQWQNNNIVIDAFASFELYHLIQCPLNQRRKKHRPTKQTENPKIFVKGERPRERARKKIITSYRRYSIYLTMHVKIQWSVQWKATEKKRRKVSMVCALCSGSGMNRACDFQERNKSYQYIWFSWMRWLPHVVFCFFFCFCFSFFLLLLSTILHTWHYVYLS